MTKRSLLFSAAILLSAHAVLASSPSARNDGRMVYTPKTTHIVLFGGTTPIDNATRLNVELNDTWEWTGVRWVQRFPVDSPLGRSGHVMVYDSARERVLVFGGKHLTDTLADTWVYQNDNWSQLQPATAPPSRYYAAGAYDIDRDRVVIFGGRVFSADKTTTTALYDTWEFDGTTWTQRQMTGPTVVSPMLVYDRLRKKTLLVGENEKLDAVLMYSWDATAGTWTAITPATLPPCVNGAAMTWQTSNNTVLLTGGICSADTAQTYEWNGTTWTKLTTTVDAGSETSIALAYDEARSVAVQFGGSPYVDNPRSTTFVFTSGGWFSVTDTFQPAQRSIVVFTADPKGGDILMYGGLNEGSVFADLWRLQYGNWQQIPAGDTTPTACAYPSGTYDTDRQKLILYCGATATIDEYDGTTWKTFSDLKSEPTILRFKAMAYDPNLKKTVTFGGYDLSNYWDETWLWDGTSWSQQKKNPAPARSHAVMWYDPMSKKVILFSGIGRATNLDRIIRYNDMWTFDPSNGWSEIKPATVPPARYGAQVAVNPANGHAFVFGGIRVDGVYPTQVQSYANDLWEWDGTNWTEVATVNPPPGRENGGMAWDPSRNRLTVFGGYAGYYLSDVWSLVGNTWMPDAQSLSRRRGTTASPAAGPLTQPSFANR